MAVLFAILALLLGCPTRPPELSDSADETGYGESSMAWSNDEFPSMTESGGTAWPTDRSEATLATTATEMSSNTDRDSDGIGNDRDNCPDLQNEDQLDCDRDGKGDRCDGGPCNMTLIPAGNFWRGSCSETTATACQTGDSGYYKNKSGVTPITETPIASVRLSGYYIDAYEVSNADYIRFLNDMELDTTNAAMACVGYPCLYYKGMTWNGFSDWDFNDEDDPDPSSIHWNSTTDQWESDYPDHPVMGINWFGAFMFCKYYGKRLPTEAEWEKAARGVDGRIYPWGNDPYACDLANGGKTVSGEICPGDSTTPLGYYKETIAPYMPLFDMAGNVIEWTADCWEKSFYASSLAQLPDPWNQSCYTSSPYKINLPVVKISTDEDIAAMSMRGGDFNSNYDYLRSAYRDVGRVIDIDDIDRAGFRCVKSATDRDYDGVADDSDNCPEYYNPYQYNTDGDEFGDLCDSDIDGDFILNEQDNCPDMSNPGQADNDADMIGNACDSDIDGDAIANDLDNCPYVSNPDQADADRDNIGDACEKS
jgi:formylglycine-generating enzyme required for sulfatase activity